MRKTLQTLWKDEDGLSTVEYALLVALMVAVAAATWDDFGQTLANSADEPMRIMENAGG